MEKSRYHWAFGAAFAAIILLAAVLRLHDLTHRPLHGDEANQAYRAGILLNKGEYRYDPFEHHGPTIYYLTLPFFWIGGAHTFAETTETELRLLPVLAGLALVALLWPLRAALGRGAVLWAALFTAVSHAMVFYSQYYVQEMLFVCFSFAVIVTGWRALQSDRFWRWALFGALLGLVQATKETCVIAAAAACASGLTLWTQARLRKTPLGIAEGLTWKHVAVALGTGTAVSVLFYSSFFTHWAGVYDSIAAYGRYLGRAEGSGSTAMHDKPWWYYFAVMLYTQREPGPFFTEALIVALALVGLIPCLCRFKRTEESRLPAFLALYTLLLTAVFSAIPYKTPWNMLLFFQGMIVLAGLGAAQLVQWLRWRPLQGTGIALLVAGAAQLGHQAWQGTALYSADPRNPYVYAHTSSALKRLVQRVEEIAAVSPDGPSLRIYVITPNGDYWPLPWYLRRYPNVGYFVKRPESLDAPFIIASGAAGRDLQPVLGEKYYMEMHALRPGVFLAAFIRKDLWDAFIATRSTP